jgi:hypothetical protein
MSRIVIVILIYQRNKPIRNNLIVNSVPWVTSQRTTVQWAQSERTHPNSPYIIRVYDPFVDIIFCIIFLYRIEGSEEYISTLTYLIWVRFYWIHEYSYIEQFFKISKLFNFLLRLISVRLSIQRNFMAFFAGCNRLGVVRAHAEQNETSHSKYYIIQRRYIDCCCYLFT